jgi:hypothetical protein
MGAAMHLGAWCSQGGARLQWQLSRRSLQSGLQSESIMNSRIIRLRQLQIAGVSGAKDVQLEPLRV